MLRGGDTAIAPGLGSSCPGPYRPPGRRPDPVASQNATRPHPAADTVAACPAVPRLHPPRLTLSAGVAAPVAHAWPHRPRHAPRVAPLLPAPRAASPPRPRLAAASPR